MGIEPIHDGNSNDTKNTVVVTVWFQEPLILKSLLILISKINREVHFFWSPLCVHNENEISRLTLITGCEKYELVDTNQNIQS